MRLVDTTTMSLRAKTARVLSGAAMMIATGVIAVAFHLTPTMAQADVLPQATQNPPEVAQAPVPEAKPSSPAPATPAKPVTPKKRTNVHRREPTPAEQPLIDKDVQQRMDDFASEIAKETANINSPEFKQQMDDIQRQMAELGPKLNGPEFKKQMDDIQRQMAEVGPKLNSPEFKQQMDDIQKEMQQQMEEFSRKYSHLPNQ